MDLFYLLFILIAVSISVNDGLVGVNTGGAYRFNGSFLKGVLIGVMLGRCYDCHNKKGPQQETLLFYSCLLLSYQYLLGSNTIFSFTAHHIHAGGNALHIVAVVGLRCE